MNTPKHSRKQMRGDLAETPFPALLFHIWKSRGSGRLEIEGKNQISPIGFSRGNIQMAAADLSPDNLLPSLEKDGLLSPELHRRCRAALKTAEADLVPTLHETGKMAPDILWRYLDVGRRNALYPLFDIDTGGFEFRPESTDDDGRVLFYIPTPEFILQGIRRMQNHSLILSHLPPEESVLATHTPEYADRLPLDPPEIYLFHLLESTRIPARVLELSLLGPRETRRGLFLFQCTEITTIGGRSGAGERAPEFSHADLHRLLDAFNGKCAAIFKYLSKEIGPAAPNILEKCVDETRARLSPFFRNLHFDNSGRVEPASILKSGPSLSSRETRRAIIRDINEILAAEILAVKKFLGNEHEAALIRLISRMGE